MEYRLLIRSQRSSELKWYMVTGVIWKETDLILAIEKYKELLKWYGSQFITLVTVPEIDIAIYPVEEEIEDFEDEEDEFEPDDEIEEAPEEPIPEIPEPGEVPIDPEKIIDTEG